jgi:hypothetical protein
VAALLPYSVRMRPGEACGAGQVARPRGMGMRQGMGARAGNIIGTVVPPGVPVWTVRVGCISDGGCRGPRVWS